MSVSVVEVHVMYMKCPPQDITVIIIIIIIIIIIYLLFFFLATKFLLWRPFYNWRSQKGDFLRKWAWSAASLMLLKFSVIYLTAQTHSNMEPTCFIQ